MHPSYIELRDDFIAEENPRFKAASLGKLGEALRKHFQQFPDCTDLPAPSEHSLDKPQREDL